MNSIKSDLSIAMRRAVMRMMALMKPSISLPFLFLDMVKGKWKRLAIAAGFQLVATLGVCLAIHRSPLQLAMEWMGVSEYFLSGMFTLQELINYFGFRGTPWSSVITATALAFLVSMVVAYRHRPAIDLFAFLAAGSVLWMYHKYYDFIMVMPALLLLKGWSGSDLQTEDLRQPSPFKRILTFGMILAISLIPYVNYSDGFLPRMVRWGGRVSLVALLGVMVMRLVRERSEEPEGSQVKQEAR